MNDPRTPMQRLLAAALANIPTGQIIVEQSDLRHVMIGRDRDGLGFDLIAHLYRQREFSERTFGPGARLEGVTDHITKELIEVRDSGGALAEWVDVILLALDGAWRSGASPEEITFAIASKQLRNESRTWPDWRTAEPGKAIEHDRAAERPKDWPTTESGHRVCSAAHPMPPGAEGRWVHTEATATTDTDYTQSYRCKACGHEWTEELPE